MDANRLAHLTRLLGDQSTAPLDEKLRRFLRHLMNPDAVYFYDDGFPRQHLYQQASLFLRLIEEGAITVGVRGSDAAQQEKGLGARPISRATNGDRTHDRATEDRDRRPGEEGQCGGETGRGDAVRAGGAELGARGGNAAQHEVAEPRPGPNTPADSDGVPEVSRG